MRTRTDDPRTPTAKVMVEPVVTEGHCALAGQVPQHAAAHATPLPSLLVVLGATSGYRVEQCVLSSAVRAGQPRDVGEDLAE